MARKYISLEFVDLEALLQSKVHEHRLIALLILVDKYRNPNGNNRKAIFDFYLKNIKSVNNWDLVDLSADKIIGAYLMDKNKSLLFNLARSESLWERRVSIISTFHFIRNRKFDDALKISEILLNDRHDLIHKAVGWMLRETGKRDLQSETGFLDKFHKTMPRTMLRYAIEKFEIKNCYEKIIYKPLSL